MEVLDHFFRQQPMDSDDDDGDDSKTLDCWELKDPNRAATWTTPWAPHTANLVFATTFKGDVRDPQHLDFKTKITKFDNGSKDKIKYSARQQDQTPTISPLLLIQSSVPSQLSITLPVSRHQASMML